MEWNMGKLAILAAVLAGAMIASVPHTISATQEVNGTQHPASYTVNGAARVTCTRAVQSAGLKPGGPRPACYLAGPGLGKQVPVNASAETNGPGTVTLTCSGQGRLGCTVRIDD
jgi:hypothetical protein